MTGYWPSPFFCVFMCYKLPRHNEYFVLLLAVSKNDIMIQMVDKPNTTPIGQDRETLKLCFI